MLGKLSDSNIISTEQLVKIEEYMVEFQAGENRKNSQKRVAGNDCKDQNEFNHGKRIRSDIYVSPCYLKQLICRNEP